MSSRHGREAFFIVGEGMRQIGSDGRPESVAPNSLQDTTEFRFSRFVPGLRNERENSTNVLAKLAVAMVGGAGRTDGYGVTIQGADGNQWYLKHLSRSSVRAGQAVVAGQVIGASGAGNSSPHLHLGQLRGNPLDTFGYR